METVAHTVSFKVKSNTPISCQKYYNIYIFQNGKLSFRANDNVAICSTIQRGFHESSSLVNLYLSTEDLESAHFMGIVMEVVKRFPAIKHFTQGYQKHASFLFFEDVVAYW